MLNVVSILIGVVALLFAVPGLIPFLGWLNWMVIPIALVGAGVGAMSRGNAGRNFNLVVLVIAVIRLSITGGFV